MGLVKNYDSKSDITIMNCYYKFPILDESGNREAEYLVIVYKDNVTGKSNYEIIEKPEYTYFKVKDNIVLDHNLLFIEKENVVPVKTRFAFLEKSIAKETGNEYFYNENIRNKNRSENRKLHTIPEIFASDISIEDYYRFIFGKEYQNSIHKINKSFFDIEVDTRWMSGDFVEMGECAINAIAFLDEKHNIIHSFLLRDSRNPQIEELENEYNSGAFNTNVIREFIKNNVGGYKQQIRFNLNNIDIKLHFFDEEIVLLKSFFSLVHQYKPDFIEGWNSSAFDLNYIITRIENLGYNPIDVMCDDSWDKKYVKHFIDQAHLSDLAERGDYTFISGTTVWIDQMIQYASRRKSKIGSFKSFKLDDIGELTAGVNKLDYSNITRDIGMLPWLNFKTFVLYNIFDVIVQKCIEAKTNDLEYIFAKAIVNNTSYKKVHRQTVYLTNRMNKEFDKLGYVIGNNVNKWNDVPDPFPGAMVHDPKNTGPYAKMKINGIPILVLETLLDFDYKSLYPSIILENNIAPNTQIGRIIIDHKVYDNENAYGNEQYSRGGEFIENRVSDNIILFCHRWLHLGNISELVEDVLEYLNKHKRSFNTRNDFQKVYRDNNSLKISVFYDTKSSDGNKPIKVFKKCNVIKPFKIYKQREM